MVKFFVCLDLEQKSYQTNGLMLDGVFILLYSTTHLHYVRNITEETTKKQENLFFYQLFL